MLTFAFILYPTPSPGPNQAAEHYYLLTEPMADVGKDWPVVEDPSRHTYIRPEGGGLMVHPSPRVLNLNPSLHPNPKLHANS